VSSSAADATALYRLRTAAELWLAERGIRQWPVGEASLDAIAGQVGQGEWWVTGDEGTVEACLRLLWTDTGIWPVESNCRLRRSYLALGFRELLERRLISLRV
jgi:hypothetical protein